MVNEINLQQTLLKWLLSPTDLSATNYGQKCETVTLLFIQLFQGAFE